MTTKHEQILFITLSKRFSPQFGVLCGSGINCGTRDREARARTLLDPLGFFLEIVPGLNTLEPYPSTCETQESQE